MRLCYIAYDFPPLNSGGSHRPARFCRNFPNLGIQTSVFTLSEYDEGAAIDSSLLSTLPAEITVHRSKMRPPRMTEKGHLGFYLRLVDSYGPRWRASLLAQIDSAWARSAFDVVMVTAPPFSTLGLGVQVARKYGVPLVVDMRDAWSLWCLTPYASILHYWATRYLEQHWLKDASAIIVPTKGVGRDLIAQHPALAEKVCVIPNGFERDTAELLRPISTAPKREYSIGYAGSFYFNPYSHHLIFEPWYRKKPYQYFQYVPRKEDWSYRSPLFFLRALAELFRVAPSWRSRLTFKIAGRQPPAIHKMVDDLGLTECVSFVGFLEKNQLGAFYDSCDFALATAVKVVDGNDYCVAGKTYECFERSLPQLGFVCQGSQRDVLESSGLSVNFDPDRVEDNARLLIQILERGASFVPDVSFLRSFDPSTTSSALAAQLRKAVRTHSL